MTGGWVATWTAATQPAGADVLPPELGGPDGCTLRQSVATSAGARRLRLRLSSAWGTRPLTVTAAVLARPRGGQAGARAIGAGSAAALRFAGQPGVTIQPGGQAVSDPLDYPAGAGTVLTVTLALAPGAAAGPVTAHPGSRTTSWLAAGQHAGEQDLAGAAPSGHWYFLSALEAWPAAGGAAVMLGDSLTDGRGSTTNGNDRWPDQLAARLRAAPATAGIAVAGQGLGGNQVLADGLGPSVLSRLPAVLAVTGARWLVVSAGVNDIGTAEPAPAAQRQLAAELTAAYTAITAAAAGRGITPCLATLTPFGGHDGYDDAAGCREAARQQVNDWIRAGTGAGTHAGAVADFDAAVRDPLRPARLRGDFDSGDHLHLNPAGYRALAEAFPVRVLTSG